MTTLCGDSPKQLCRLSPSKSKMLVLQKIKEKQFHTNFKINSFNTSLIMAQKMSIELYDNNFVTFCHQSKFVNLQSSRHSICRTNIKVFKNFQLTHHSTKHNSQKMIVHLIVHILR
jgi:hypothetical protein